MYYDLTNQLFAQVDLMHLTSLEQPTLKKYL